MSDKFEPLSPAQLAEEVTPAPQPTESSKVAGMIKDARKRERRMRATWEARKELESPGQWELDPYRVASKEELLALAEETLPTEELKQAIKEREGT